MANCLETSQVSKFFGGLIAVDKVDLEIPERSIYSIIGPNGAGKTTLFNCISGYYTPEHGAVRYFGKEIQGLSTDTIAGLGIARTYQNIRLFKEMTAIENVLIGQQPHMRSTWLDAALHTRRYNLEAVSYTHLTLPTN
jgi:branched-chain amino acid transport system ATP-binding protein